MLHTCSEECGYIKNNTERYQTYLKCLMLKIFYMVYVGCLGEGKSVARALWQQQKEALPVEEKKEGGSSVAGRSTVDAAANGGASEVCSLAETADGSKSSTSHTDFQNTVVYGLPHITMIPPVS